MNELTHKDVAKVTRVEYSFRMNKTYCWVQLHDGTTARLWLNDNEVRRLTGGQD